MPCRDGREDECRVEFRENPVSQRLIEKVDKLTELLCFVMQNVENDYWYKEMILDSAFERKNTQNAEDLMNWWGEHKRIDAAREAKEEAERQESTKRAELLVRLNKEFNLEELDELRDLF